QPRCPPLPAGHECPAAILRCNLGCNSESVAEVNDTVSNRRRAGGQRRHSDARTPQSGIDIAMQHQMRQTGPTLQVAETPMPAVAKTKPPQAGHKDMYDIAEVPQLGQLPSRKHSRWNNY